MQIVGLTEAKKNNLKKNFFSFLLDLTLKPGIEKFEEKIEIYPLRLHTLIYKQIFMNFDYLIHLQLCKYFCFFFPPANI